MYLSCSIKPSLKKVSKYENKFAKLQKKAGEFNLRSQLKNVKKKEFTMDEEEPGVRVRERDIQIMSRKSRERLRDSAL